MKKTCFPEFTNYLFISHGPIQYLDEGGNTTGLIDWPGKKEKWEGAEIIG